MAQQPTGPPVYEVQSSTGWTGDALIFVFRQVIFVQPMLDLHQYRRAGEQDLSHPENMTVLKCQTMMYRKVNRWNHRTQPISGTTCELLQQRNNNTLGDLE
jgi:hypothetical protein